mgnify:FL=1
MTVSKALIQWLYGYGNIQIDERIETDVLAQQAISYALYKEPNAIVDTYIDDSQMRTEYYTFLARRNTQIESERQDNNAFLEELENWIDEKNLSGELPQLDGSRYCEDVSVSSGLYLYTNEDNQAVYALTIQIKYRKELN